MNKFRDMNESTALLEGYVYSIQEKGSKEDGLILITKVTPDMFYATGIKNNLIVKGDTWDLDISELQSKYKLTKIGKLKKVKLKDNEIIDL